MLYPFSNATRLAHITIVVEGEQLQEEEAKSLVQSLGGTPALHCLEYSGLDVPTAEAMARSMPLLNQLTTLRLVVRHYHCVEPALHVIRKCTSATWILLSSRGPGHWGFIDIDAWPSLHLPNLRILEIGETVILPLFHCPNLQVLSISSKPHLVALQVVPTYISTSKHSLQVLRLQAMQRYDLTWFFRNRDFIRIPILEVRTMRDEKVGLDGIRKEVLDRMWERLGGSRAPTFAAYGTGVTALGWVDSKVFHLFSEYFENTRKFV
ncbi:hypothetical protein P691DRAFT_764681 [Macrolepiota fuliginosa MF-IS2]|uniref:Uncharacterized protein n=1 Tax=Macrolepiota fuliginosa MF-IS2 TaxID=1400762 RepID=A0A9P5X1R9_9AGAR|nr:hypothetical protein P691DRAFT_764681 [Macrolepiota fuliginosa MF-IS2]